MSQEEMSAADFRKAQRAPEGQLVNAVIRYLWARGCYAWRNSVGAMRNEQGRLLRFGLPGSSDVLGIAPGGRLICVECKSEQGRLSDKQRDFLEQVAARGGIAIVAKPSNYAEIIDLALHGDVAVPGEEGKE